MENITQKKKKIEIKLWMKNKSNNNNDGRDRNIDRGVCLRCGWGWRVVQGSRRSQKSTFVFALVIIGILEWFKVCVFSVVCCCFGPVFCIALHFHLNFAILYCFLFF